MKDKQIIKIKTKMGEYDCLFDANYPEKGYTVTAPKLKGVITFGDTLNEAKKMMKEAIELHCESLLYKGLAEVKIISFPKSKISVSA